MMEYMTQPEYDDLKFILNIALSSDNIENKDHVSKFRNLICYERSSTEHIHYEPCHKRK
jgi:hypothetical protein